MSSTGNPLLGWSVDRSAISTIDTGLPRPECILAERGCTQRVRSDGSLYGREVFGRRGRWGAVPEGVAFDPFGNLSVTLVMTDVLIVLTLLEDGDSEKAANFKLHFDAGTMTPAIMGATHGTIAPWMASATFGRSGPAHGLHRQPARHDQSVVPLADAGTTHGALERTLAATAIAFQSTGDTCVH
jgi:hypothetical protein